MSVGQQDLVPQLYLLVNLLKVLVARCRVCRVLTGWSLCLAGKVKEEKKASTESPHGSCSAV